MNREGNRLKESCKKVENSAFEMTVILRIRNPGAKRSSWRQKNPAIQRRLDYWLITISINLL